MSTVALIEVLSGLVLEIRVATASVGSSTVGNRKQRSSLLKRISGENRERRWPMYASHKRAIISVPRRFASNSASGHCRRSERCRARLALTKHRTPASETAGDTSLALRLCSCCLIRLRGRLRVNRYSLEATNNKQNNVQTMSLLSKLLDGTV